MLTHAGTAVRLQRDPVLPRIIALLFFCLVAVPCGSGWAQERAAEAGRISSDFSLGPGEYTLKIANNRKYLLHIPASYSAARATPLVLFFHGGGGHMEQAAADYGWREKSEQEGFIVAFPNGSSPLPRQHLATWNAGECCAYARDENIDDVGFVRQVIADIERQVHIDAGKIFATGMSNGGMLVHRLACEMADIFQAVASVAGTDNTRGCNPCRPISVLHIHARDDTHVLFNGGAGKDAFRDESKVTSFTSVADTINRWIVRNKAEKTPRRVLGVPGAYGDLYTSKQNDARIELIVTETGGHSWPGGKAILGKKPSQVIIANDVIWDFFMNQAR
ncbi:MAG: PHB depolymerase family esterase [Desulfatitalea sp.]